MTEDKARKRAIRTRMAKTGERYTAARRHVARRHVASPLPPRKADPGFPEATVRERTGHGWDHWFRILDDWGAAGRAHGEITRYLGQEHGVAPWWTQAVARGYELARGMRRPNEGSRGFAVGVSKTFPVGISELAMAFIDDGRRRRWLEPGTLRLRSSRPGKSCRYDFRDGSRVHAYFVSKGRGKSTLTIEHERLPRQASVEEMRAFWKERLTRLGEILG